MVFDLRNPKTQFVLVELIERLPQVLHLKTLSVARIKPNFFQGDRQVVQAAQSS
jgi:hypothetical protein